MIIMSNVFSMLIEYFISGIALALNQINLRYEDKHKGD